MVLCILVPALALERFQGVITSSSWHAVTPLTLIAPRKRIYKLDKQENQDLLIPKQFWVYVRHMGCSKCYLVTNTQSSVTNGCLTCMACSFVPTSALRAEWWRSLWTIVSDSTSWLNIFFSCMLVAMAAACYRSEQNELFQVLSLMQILQVQNHSCVFIHLCSCTVYHPALSQANRVVKKAKLTIKALCFFGLAQHYGYGEMFWFKSC